LNVLPPSHVGWHAASHPRHEGECNCPFGRTSLALVGDVIMDIRADLLGTTLGDMGG
jgi:hypothetical protein